MAGIIAQKARVRNASPEAMVRFPLTPRSIALRLAAPGALAPRGGEEQAADYRPVYTGARTGQRVQDALGVQYGAFSAGESSPDL